MTTPLYQDRVKLYWLVFGPYAVGVRSRSPRRAIEAAGRGEPEKVLVVTDDGIEELEGVVT
jgi:ABC-type sugar transport system substrate-binding protein